METIEVRKKNAQAAYKVADKNIKQVLEELLGKENLIAGKIIDQVKTFDDAYEIFMDLDFTDDLYKNLQTRQKDNLTSIDQLMIIAKILQEDWRPDYSNGQRKWFPYFEYSSKISGFGLSFSYYDYTFTHAGSGSRLCLETQEKSDYFGKQFIELWNKFLLTK